MIKNKRAFTLIELLVVVLIIGILAAVALPQYQKAVYKSRTVEAVVVLSALATAQEVFFLNHGSYTTEIRELDVNIPDELLETDMQIGVLGKFTDKYSYRCVMGKCSGRVNNPNMPFLEFVLFYNTEREGVLAGKKYCHVYGYPDTKNDTAKTICQSMGTEDNAIDEAWFAGKYFILK